MESRAEFIPFNPHNCSVCWVVSLHFASEEKGLTRQGGLSKVIGDGGFCLNQGLADSKAHFTGLSYHRKS